MLFEKNNTDIEKVRTFFRVGKQQDALSKKDKTPGILQWSTDTLISSFNVENIKVYINSGLNNFLIYAATSNWSLISGCKIGFYNDEYLAANESNTIAFIDSGTDPALYGFYALAQFPTISNAGYRIRINTSYTGLSQYIYILTHEIGHCIGLRHTDNPGYNSYGTNAISRTPTFDSNSIMNQRAGSPVKTWSSFSTYDIIVALILYPHSVFDNCIDDSSISDIDPDYLSFNLRWNNAMLTTKQLPTTLSIWGL